MQLDLNGQSLKQNDPDRFLISLFASAERREALWALFCFHHEISKTRFVVTETQLGLIRLQWWREEIAKLYDGQTAPENPVLQGLEAAIRDYGLKQALFENMIYAREFDLEGVAPQGMEGLKNYADLTTTPLNKLALQIAGEDEEEEVLQALSIRYCLIKLFLSIPFYKAQGFILIEENIREEIINVISKDIEKTSSKLLNAQNALCKIYLKKLQSCDFDPFHEKMNIPPWFKELRVLMKVSF